MRKLLLCIMVLFFTGCASTEAYRDYMTAYTGYLQTAKQANNSGKLIEIEAVDGEPITITAKKFIVYAPANGQIDNVKPPDQIKQSEWVGTVNALIGSASTLGMGAIIGSAVKGIVQTTATNAGHNTQTTSTTTSTDSHNSDSHNSSSTTSTTTTTDSHNTTTSTDSHNTTSTSTDSHNTSTTTTTGATGTTTGGTVTQ